MSYKHAFEKGKKTLVNNLLVDTHKFKVLCTFHDNWTSFLYKQLNFHSNNNQRKNKISLPSIQIKARREELLHLRKLITFQEHLARARGHRIYVLKVIKKD